ncbi:hypothetical protein K9O30_06470 [Clostridium bowmanii]|uniref:hypothetical protein n=1 Tax=Clostridium bowmanii TaxID=132925 RepID=UPI001C0E8756|nr:hypothetical protein [Clostridium bowmanii]MBU3188804.1 hypothetical protein [Clostridium bowmanii]MCA1073387.1 hypothetical protein [Clostridium bowmanii]
MMPLKKSNRWIWIFILYTIIIFTGLLTTRFILGSEILVKYILSLILISLVSALIPCIGGFLGKRLFFLIYTFCTIVGILYMFYVVLGNTAPGWGDLTSIVGLLFMVGVGATLGLVVEVILYFVKRKQSK